MVLVCCGCEFKLKPNEDGDNVESVEVKRYDRLESRYLTTGDFSALQQMNTDYPMETRTLLEKMLQLGSVDDPEINNKFLNFYQDAVLQTLIADAESEYANMDDINERLNDAFDNLKKDIPGLPIPMVYTQIGALDQSIIIGDNSIGISLDKYLGVNYPLYKKYYSYTQRLQMTRENIVPDCLSFYLLGLYPMHNADSCTQLERDLHVGKVMWVVNKALGVNFFRTDFVARVDRYMKRNSHITVLELLKNENYTCF